MDIAIMVMTQLRREQDIQQLGNWVYNRKNINLVHVHGETLWEMACCTWNIILFNSNLCVLQVITRSFPGQHANIECFSWEPSYWEILVPSNQHTQNSKYAYSQLI